jgi:hypothetical protein
MAACCFLLLCVIDAPLVRLQNTEVNACVAFECYHQTPESQAQATCTDIIGGKDDLEGRICACPSGLFYEEFVGCVPGKYLPYECMISE